MQPSRYFYIGVAVYLGLFMVLLSAGLGALWLIRGSFGRRRWRRRYQRAATALVRDAPRVQQDFLSAAAQMGDPRGLVWKQSSFDNIALLVHDRATGDMYALVRITGASDAMLGGGMEDMVAVSNPRFATAVLEWKGSRWTTAGRVLFNLEPLEVVERYADHLQAICHVDLPPA